MIWHAELMTSQTMSSHVALSKVCTGFLKTELNYDTQKLFGGIHFREVTSVFLFSWGSEAYAILETLLNADLVKYGNNKYKVSDSGLYN